MPGPAAAPEPLSPAALAARVAALAGRDLGTKTRIALAVSGGADSLALLWLAAGAFPGRVTALGVDHRLRPEAADELAGAACAAASLGVPWVTIPLDAPPGPANLQAQARAARYAALAGWCRAHETPLLLTAHHRDDQAETILMRLMRGSGLSGLAGIRERVEIDGVLVLRPLLPHARAELAGIVNQAGWAAAQDPSNRDPRHDRTRVRALLAREPMLDPARLAASAAHLADAEAALDWAAERAWASRARRYGDAILVDPEGLPAELRRRLLLRAFAELGADGPDGPALARLQAALEAGRTATLAGIAARALGDGGWRLRLAAPRHRT
ncbi:MAG: tRNA lysidine(34) synthetase TilS [Sphingomonadaceae bacterium]